MSLKLVQSKEETDKLFEVCATTVGTSFRGPSPPRSPDPAGQATGAGVGVGEASMGSSADGELGLSVDRFTNLVADLRAFRERDTAKAGLLGKDDAAKAFMDLGLDFTEGTLQMAFKQVHMTAAAMGEPPPAKPDTLNLVDYMRVIKGMADNQSMRRQRPGRANATTVTGSVLAPILGEGDDRKRMLTA